MPKNGQNLGAQLRIKLQWKCISIFNRRPGAEKRTNGLIIVLSRSCDVY